LTLSSFTLWKRQNISIMEELYKKFMEETNRLLSFYKTRTPQKTPRRTSVLLLRVYSLPR
jgi:hypothetical protein